MAREAELSNRQKLVEKFDTDGDGVLSADERKAFNESEHGRRRAQVIEQFDTDGDGVLSTDERTAAIESNRAKHRAKMLEEFDADGDGVLSDDERQAAQAARKKRGGKRGGHGEEHPENRGPPDAGDPSPR